MAVDIIVMLMHKHHTYIETHMLKAVGGAQLAFCSVLQMFTEPIHPAMLSPMQVGTCQAKDRC